MMDHSEEARARRAARVTMRRAQRQDPLAERVRIINFWRACSETNRHYLPSCGAWWRPFITQPGLRRHLMPKLRARIEAQERAWRERIGNAVPADAAQAIASEMGRTLLLAWSGETFALSMAPVWVRPVAVGLSMAQGGIHG